VEDMTALGIKSADGAPYCHPGLPIKPSSNAKFFWAHTRLGQGRYFSRVLQAALEYMVMHAANPCSLHVLDSAFVPRSHILFRPCHATLSSCCITEKRAERFPCKQRSKKFYSLCILASLLPPVLLLWNVLTMLRHAGKSPLPASKRRRFFSDPKNRKGREFTPGHMYTFHFWQHMLDCAAFKLDLGIAAFDLAKHLDGEPLQLMAQQKRNSAYLWRFQLQHYSNS